VVVRAHILHFFIGDGRFCILFPISLILERNNNASASELIASPFFVDKCTDCYVRDP
jgi:hypothetical protein